MRKAPNYFKRHWRGELSLPVSFWINGLLGNIGAAIAIAAVAASFFLKDEFHPLSTLAGATLIWIIVLLFSTWMAVGIWRAAANHGRANPRSYWGVAAKVCVFLAVMRSLTDFANAGGLN
jgi:hypothetical protein